MDSLSNAVNRRQRRRGRYDENDPDRPSTAAEIQEARLLAQLVARNSARALQWKNKYLKSPEFMLCLATIKDDIDAMASVMTENNLSPDLKIYYLDEELHIKNDLYDNVPKSLLSIAFYKKNQKAISFLIDKGANFLELIRFGPNEEPYYLTTLYIAVENKLTDVVNKILSKKPSSEFINYNMAGRTALKLAINISNIEYVKLLLQAGANVNGVGRGCSPLELALARATENDSYEIADFLKQSGAAMPSMRNRQIKEYGVYLNHNLNSLNWILKNYLSSFGLPDNTYAQEPMNPEDILFKIAHLKNKNFIEQGFFNWTQDSYDSEQEHRRRIFLIKPLLNKTDSSGNTALMAAVSANNYILTVHLINFGAKTAIKNNEGNTALHLAALNATSKTGEQRQNAIKIINHLIDKNQALTKIKNNNGYGAGNPKLGVNAEITKLIHGRKPWFGAKNTNKANKGGAKNVSCKQSAFAWKASSVAKSPFKTLKAAKKAAASKKPIGFTATSSLKAMGRLPRSNGCYKLGPKYE